MALPGLSLPGLGLSQPSPTPFAGATPKTVVQRTRIEDLAPRSEWRFEVSFSQHYNIKIESGYAELFGVELAPKQTYSFSGYKGAIFTWQGCQLEISGEAESEYAGQETEYAVEWLNVHGMLETLRSQNSTEGPRVLVVGPDFVGKSSLVRSLAAWDARTGRTPVVLNLDPREGLLAVPSSLTAVTIDSQTDVENGYGIGPMSGPTTSPVRTPLIYHFPFSSPTEKPTVYKSIATRMALTVMNKLEDDPSAKRSGLLMDTPGSLNDPKSNYDLITHLVSEFSITLILSLGSERLASDLTRRFSGPRPSGDDPITVLRIAKPGGAVERDASFMKQLRTQQIRQYFFGSAKESLNPHSHTLSFTELNIFRVRASDASSSTSSSNPFGPGAGDDDNPNDDAEDDDDYDIPYATRRPHSSGGGHARGGSTGGGGVNASASGFERVTPSVAMTGSLVAIKFCPGSGGAGAVAGVDEGSVVRDSAVMGYLYVAEVDEARKKVRFLAPHPQRWGDRALVWGGGWPEAGGDLVT